MKQNKYVIFIDIKEFSYKNALLTDFQVEKILKKFEDIVVRDSKAFWIQIVKSIGDAYMLLADDPEDTYNFSLGIIQNISLYDDTQKIDLTKISARIWISYGEVTQNTSMSLDDYFWDAINLAARIVDITPAWHIFCSDRVKQNIYKKRFQNIWEYEFHGVIEKSPIHSLMDISHEEIYDVMRKSNSLYRQGDSIVYQCACVSAILSAQPIPFVENFNVIGIHLFMIMKLSAKFWKPVNLLSAKKIFTDIITPLWVSYMALQWANTAVKILLPWIGWYMYVPLSFATTYALWKVYTAYFFYDMWGKKLSDSVIKNIFVKQKGYWKTLAKKKKKEILSTWKLVYKDVMSIKDRTGYTRIQKELKAMLSSKK